MIEIEFFLNVAERDQHNSLPLDELICWAMSDENLKNNTYKYRKWLNDNPNASRTQKSEKKLRSFPAVIFGGTFTGTGTANDVNKMSGLMVLDFDHINIEKVLNRLKNDKYTFLLFTSPSGDGLKIVVKHNLTEPVQWHFLYLELEEYYSTKYDLETDKSGKDISRMCFLPFIENLHRNDESLEWKYSGKFKNKKVTPNTNMSASLDIYEQSNLYIECNYIASYLNENYIDITENYDEWISYGYSLCSLGERGKDIFHKISAVSEKYDESECTKNFEYMLKHYDPERTNINVFLNNAKQAIAHHSVFIKYGFLCS